MTATGGSIVARTAAFAGWRHQAGGPWRQLCQAETEAACWRRLLDLLAGSGSSCVLPAGRHPNDPPGGQWPNQKPNRRPAYLGQRQCSEQQRELFT
jgi:hypothetical protein